MSLRTATKQDLPDLITLYTETISHARFPSSYIKKYLNQGRIIKKCMNGNIAGAYIIDINRNGSPYDIKLQPHKIVWLEQIMVFERYQGNGFGTEMMNHYLKYPTKEYRLVCQKSLIPFYKRFGFQAIETGVRKGKSYTIMSKSINTSKE